MSDDEGTEQNGADSRSRRELLGLAGLGAAGLAGGAALAWPKSAGAADGGPLLIGSTNAGNSKTELDTGGPATPNEGAFKVVAPTWDYGVIGSAKTVGTFGSAAVGVLGDGAVGGQFSGTDAAINLEPRLSIGPPGGTNFKGDIVVDSDGVLWLCIAGGAPGNWIKVSHGGVRFLSAPARVYDSRNDAVNGKLKKDELRNVNILSAVPSIPSAAVGVIGNLAATQTVGAGNVAVFPTGVTPPATANINWGAPNVDISNGISVALGTSGQITLKADVTASSGQPATHVVVDVAGYVL
jgi:hypothetical protein